MTLLYLAMLLVLLGLSVVCITLSLRFLRDTPLAHEQTSTAARFFLIALRLAIGWQCFVEGVDKFSTPNWSSEAYQRESIGPCAGFYRWIAGDRLVERLTLGADDAFPERLDREWHDYLDAFAAYYDLSTEKRELAGMKLDQQKKDTLSWMLSQKEWVTKISPYPPALELEWTVKQRLDEHERLLARVREAEAQFPSTDKAVHTRWKDAKADLNKWRADLKKSLDAQTDKFKKALEDVLDSDQKQKTRMPEPIRTPISSWRLLEISDGIVQWSLLILGGCVMLGLCSRVSCLALAGLIVTFYAAMPPLPGWPESPKLEGHYVMVNKTLIEIIALIALANLPTGRWAGLDGLIQACLPGCCGAATTAPSTTSATPPVSPA